MAPGHSVLYIGCNACKHEAKLEGQQFEEQEGFERLKRLRCSQCGSRDKWVRFVWSVDPDFTRLYRV